MNSLFKLELLQLSDDRENKKLHLFHSYKNGASCLMRDITADISRFGDEEESHQITPRRIVLVNYTRISLTLH